MKTLYIVVAVGIAIAIMVFLSLGENIYYGASIGMLALIGLLNIQIDIDKLESELRITNKEKYLVESRLNYALTERDNLYEVIDSLRNKYEPIPEIRPEALQRDDKAPEPGSG